MFTDTLPLFVPACFALNMAFGPNNLLSITIGARDGLKFAILAAFGRLSAFAIMIAVAALGMAALLTASEIAFNIVKTAGAAYLIWLGIKFLRSKPEGSAAFHVPQAPTLRELFRQEFLIAIGNPKAILIFTAFFPQFVSTENYWGSYSALGAVFLALELLAVAIYSFAGSRLPWSLRDARGLRWVNGVSGISLILFGGLLATAERPST